MCSRAVSHQQGALRDILISLKKKKKKEEKRMSICNSAWRLRVVLARCEKQPSSTRRFRTNPQLCTVSGSSGAYNIHVMVDVFTQHELPRGRIERSPPSLSLRYWEYVYIKKKNTGNKFKKMTIIILPQQCALILMSRVIKNVSQGT